MGGVKYFGDVRNPPLKALPSPTFTIVGEPPVGVWKLQVGDVLLLPLLRLVAGVVMRVGVMVDVPVGVVVEVVGGDDVSNVIAGTDTDKGTAVAVAVEAVMVRAEDTIWREGAVPKQKSSRSLARRDEEEASSPHSSSPRV